MSQMTIGQRLEYTLRTRIPMALKKLAEYAPSPPGSAPFLDPKLILQEADYVLGESVNVAYQKTVAVASELEGRSLDVGKSYRFTFEAEQPQRNFTLPGDGFVEIPGYSARLRVYKIAFRGGNLVDVDGTIYREAPAKTQKTAAAAVVAIPIVVIVAVIAAALLSVFGYLALREVREIVVSPAGFGLIAIAVVLLLPTIRGAIGR
jgi:hypothetical protein